MHPLVCIITVSGALYKHAFGFLSTVTLSLDCSSQWSDLSPQHCFPHQGLAGKGQLGGLVVMPEKAARWKPTLVGSRDKSSFRGLAGGGQGHTLSS